MKIIFIYLLVAFISLSCFPEKSPSVEILNKSSYNIDSIKVFTSKEKPTTFYSLERDAFLKGEIMIPQDTKGDGCYKI